MLISPSTRYLLFPVLTPFHRYPHLVQVSATASNHPAFVAAAPESQVDYRP